VTDTHTITGELLIPGAVMQAYDVPDLERRLRNVGLLPIQAVDRRWRMDPDTPGHYRLMFRVPFPPDPAA
jgi:hypothetical protein